MKRTLHILLISLLVIATSYAQPGSLILLGDLHYDRMEDHVMDYLADKPGDLNQVRQYTELTEKHWVDFMKVIQEKAVDPAFPAAAILQAGDFSEGLAGSVEKAKQMARHAMEAIETADMPVPWILAKGNHDITGPGAGEAFKEYYIPMIRKQTGNPGIRSATYSYISPQVKVVCLDPWDSETDPVDFLERELSDTSVTFRFVLVHEPLIPVTERCWHMYRDHPERREKLLEVIARNRGIVLCGHLHRYSVVRRNTACGPVVQVMAISVVSDRSQLIPGKVITDYGPSLAEAVPDWHPESLESRMAMLQNEAQFVTFFKQADLPGYARIKIHPNTEEMELEYYAAFGKEPFDTIDLTTLLKPD